MACTRMIDFYIKADRLIRYHTIKELNVDLSIQLNVEHVAEKNIKKRLKQTPVPLLVLIESTKSVDIKFLF